MRTHMFTTLHRCARRTCLLHGLLFFLASPAQAHDFWIQPREFLLQPNVAIAYTLQVGHGPMRQQSPIAPSRIVRFDARAPDGAVIDLRPTLHGSDRTQDDVVSFAAPGTYVVAFVSDDHAQSRLPAIRFNDYLTAEGLTPALDERRRRGLMDANGAEKYSRVAKSIVRIGVSADNAVAVTRPLGLPLEIVPSVNPYAQPSAEGLPVTVIYRGHALPGALVKFTDLEHDDAPFETRITDPAGQAVFTLPKTGQWLLNVIWTRPLPDSEDVDFETVFSSLSLAFP